MEEPNIKLSGVLMLLAKISRRFSVITLACVVLFLPSPSAALAQTPQPASQPQEPEAGVEDNPTRTVFFSVREEYRNLIEGAWNNRLVLRRDAVVLKGKHGGGRTGYLLRTDVPITTTHLGSETHKGLGDIYGQALYTPYLFRKFAFVTGAGIVPPNATHKTLGLGK